MEEKTIGDFSWALLRLKNGQRVFRTGWNNAGISVEMQVPDEHSKMTKPYLYMNKNKDKFPCDLSCESLLADDWQVV